MRPLVHHLPIELSRSRGGDGGRLQVFRECGHYPSRHRTCPSDTQETILIRARSISKLRVTKANLEPSTRLILCQRVNLKCYRADAAMKAPPDYVLSAPNAPVPLVFAPQFRRCACRPAGGSRIECQCDMETEFK